MQKKTFIVEVKPTLKKTAEHLYINNDLQRLTLATLQPNNLGVPISISALSKT
jgi:hypothetical protein